MSTHSAAAAPLLQSDRRYSIADSLKLLGISKKKFYQNVKDGRIKTLHDGRRAFVHGSEIIRASTVSTK